MSDGIPHQPAGPRLARGAGRHVFGTDVDGYHRARLGYPDALYRLVLDQIGGGEGKRIAEIGAGTGLATQHLLAANPARLVAIEPNPALAKFLAERFRHTVVEVIEAGFVEARPTGRFDLIAAAACFHWLDPVAALARAQALIVPGGCLALWWNVYRQTGIGDPFAEAIMPLLAELDLPPSEGLAGHYSLDAPLHREALHSIGLEVVAEQVFRRERTLSAAEARALYESYSSIRALGRSPRMRLLDAISDLVETRFGGAAPNVVLTPVYVGRAPLGA